MTKYSNLFLVINLGCEMLYVIHQRIIAQKIPTIRGIQVLTDITEVLLNETLLQELASAISLASHKYVRVLLEDIVSVSIMRLDEHSMRKLWELMTMIFKWQLTLSDEKSLLILTTRHLHGISKLTQLQAVRIQNRISATIEFINKIGQEISVNETILIRNSLMHWLCDFRTNISLLLRLGFQRNDGSFITSIDNMTYLNSLGQNIYTIDESINEAENYDYKATESYDGDSPEIICVIGDGSEPKDNRKLKVRLFDQQTSETVNKTSDSKPIYYTQTQSESVERRNSLNSSDVENQDTLPPSVHDDLIKMLDLSN